MAWGTHFTLGSFIGFYQSVLPWGATWVAHSPGLSWAALLRSLGVNILALLSLIPQDGWWSGLGVSSVFLDPSAMP